MTAKLRHDLTWGAVTAVAVTVLSALVEFRPEAVTDWRVWAAGLGGAAVRSGAQATLQALLSARDTPPTE